MFYGRQVFLSGHILVSPMSRYTLVTWPSVGSKFATKSEHTFSPLNLNYIEAKDKRNYLTEVNMAVTKQLICI